MENLGFWTVFKAAMAAAAGAAAVIAAAQQSVCRGHRSLRPPPPPMSVQNIHLAEVVKLKKRIIRHFLPPSEIFILSKPYAFH